MKKNLLLLILFYVQGVLFSQNDGFSFISKLLHTENKSTSFDIQRDSTIYNNFLTEIRNELKTENDLYDKHEELFYKLHKTFFKKYNEISYLSALFDSKEYNCVTSTILYYAISIDLGLIVNIYESPRHVYLSVPVRSSKEIILELTDPSSGFDFNRDKDDYIDMLLSYKMITQEELNSKGEDQIYQEYVVNSVKLDQNRLFVIHLINLALYSLQQSKTYEAYRLANFAITNNQDSVFQKTYSLIWLMHFTSLDNDLSEMHTFLLESLESPIPSKDFESMLIQNCSYLISEHLKARKYDLADSIYNNLYRKLTFTDSLDHQVLEISKIILLYKIDSKLIRGEYQEGYDLAKKLLNKFRDQVDVQETYIRVCRLYLEKLSSRANFEKTKEIVDSLYTDLPGVNSVEDIYISSILSSIFTSGYYIMEPAKSKAALLEAYKLFPSNLMIVKGLATLFHEAAMKEIRSRNYKNAVIILEEGLIYDLDNYELKNELKLTKELL